MVTQSVVYHDNPVFELAENFVTATARSVFLTGKAGTGKTTFLRHIRKNSRKKTVVVAPTGIAAINAGGVTIHSFFQLPFSPIIPPQPHSLTGESLFDRSGLIRNLKIDSDKRSLYREIEVLIIDEVSMVRCDILDALDTILRYVRQREDLPFGGVQVLFIGDLFQLPPVVQHDEWKLLQNYYESPYFFDSFVVRQYPPVYIELKKIYRQTDPVFISLLNRVRANAVGAEDIERLNSRYRPDFKPEQGFITLTTHNRMADSINNDSLRRLDQSEFAFEGEVEGDFPERNYPTEKRLVLKQGAQVMFIKNDPERRYYNGKIGTVSEIGAGKIKVNFPGEEDIEVTRDSWRNVRYTFNAVTREVEEEVLGVFTQYPIRLAWAITIHKSQGLTFRQVVIDAGRSFAPGQVYVALSRCTSLEGIVLHSRIFGSAIRTDERVLAFAEKELSEDQLAPLLQREKKQYKLSVLTEIFDWSIARDEVKLFLDHVDEKKFFDRDKAREILDGVEAALSEFDDISPRFISQLRTLAAAEEWEKLHERVEAGTAFFVKGLDERVLTPLHKLDAWLRTGKKVKKTRKQLGGLVRTFENIKQYFERAPALAATIPVNEEGNAV